MPATTPALRRDGRPWLPLVVFGIGVLGWVGGVLAYGLWLATPEPLTEYEQLMADGSILKIEAVTTGTAHTFKYHRPPSFFQSLFPWWRPPPVPLKDDGTPQQIVLWMSRRDAKTDRPLDFRWWRENVVIDAAGNEIVRIGLPYPTLNGPSEGGLGNQTASFTNLRTTSQLSAWILSTPLPPFRPQGDRLKLRVKNAAGDVVAEFDLPHPKPSVLPE